MASSLQGRDKFARVVQLIEWGYNAPLYHKIACKDTIVKYMKHGSVKQEVLKADPIQVIIEIMLHHQYDRVSIRFPGSLGKPSNNMINVTIEEVMCHYHWFQEVDWVMVSEGMPIAAVSGCIELHSDGSFILEAVYGKPVRVLTHGKQNPDVRIWSNLDSDRWRYCSDSNMGRVIDLVRTTGPLSDIIYEFSVFPFKLGSNHKNILFWEYEELNYGQSKCYPGFPYTSSWGCVESNFLPTI